MKKKALHSASSNVGANRPQQTIRSTIPVVQLRRYTAGWILDSKSQQHSPNTVDNREQIIGKLIWFLEHRAFTEVGVAEMRAFLGYFHDGHKEPGGRWGNPRLTDPPRPSTVKTYYANLCVMWKWIREEGGIDVDVMGPITAPRVRQSQIQPFSDEQVNALLAAARRSSHPKRDEAILLLLLDSGLRVSELAHLKRGEIDMIGRKCQVLGKGNKFRSGFFGRSVSRTLNAYMREERTKGFEMHDPLFISDRGRHASRALTRSGILQLVDRLGERAGIPETVRCSPHTFRHTFAVNFLRSGGNMLALREILGHTSLEMTQRYVNFAQSDIESQHRDHSPADRIKKR